MRRRNENDNWMRYKKILILKIKYGKEYLSLTAWCEENLIELKWIDKSEVRLKSDIE